MDYRQPSIHALIRATIARIDELAILAASAPPGSQERALYQGYKRICEESLDRLRGQLSGRVPYEIMPGTEVGRNEQEKPFKIHTARAKTSGGDTQR